MFKYSLLLLILFSSSDSKEKTYPWLESYDKTNTVATRIKVPEGFKRVEVKENSFEWWLRNLPLKPADTPVKLWNGELKYDQNLHAAVVEIDFIGKNLQQCIDAIIRLRAEFLMSANREKEIQFSYSCCSEKLPWTKWKQGYRTKITETKGNVTFSWIKTHSPDSSIKNFRAYLNNIMNYAGTLSLSRDMMKIKSSEVKIGDAFVHGAAPGSGHGVLIIDMAVSSTGKKLMLLGQSYNPAENFNIIKCKGKYSPWVEVEFGENLVLPEWVFTADHARRFE